MLKVRLSACILVSEIWPRRADLVRRSVFWICFSRKMVYDVHSVIFVKHSTTLSLASELLFGSSPTSSRDSLMLSSICNPYSLKADASWLVSSISSFAIFLRLARVCSLYYLKAVRELTLVFARPLSRMCFSSLDSMLEAASVYAEQIISTIRRKL
jgi:hypothetical protein